MHYASRISWQEVEAAIEVADPELSILVFGECRNISIGQNGGARLQNLFPAESLRRQIEHAAPRQDVNIAISSEKLLYFGELRWSLAH